MISRRVIKITFPILLLAGIYFLGPAPAKPVYNLTLPAVPSSPPELESYVAMQDAKHKLRPDNEAQIVWNDSSKQKTKYAVVYLHGFSASQMEGNPIHRRFAKEFGCNLFLSRLADHGIDTTEALLLYTPDRSWNSAKEALAIGKQLGDKVILMSTSTGSTLALKLAAEYPEDVYGLINMSPNVVLKNEAAVITNDPWGLQIARLVVGGNYNVSTDTVGEKYWYLKYRLEGVGQMEELLETTMTKKTFERVKQPSLSLCYYKSEEEQDDVVKVSAIRKMNEELGTPADMKVLVDIPTAGAHVIGSPLKSKAVEQVYQEIEKFAKEKLNL